MLGDVFAYLTDGANWSGPDRHRRVPGPAAAADVHGDGRGDGRWGCRSRCGPATGTVRVPRHQRLQRRAGGARVRRAARALPGAGRLRGVRPLRPRRPGHADLPRAVRAAAADHQHLRRHHRGRPGHRRGVPWDGDGRGQGVLLGRAPPVDAGDHDRRTPGPGPGVGHRDDRRAGRRARGWAASSPAGSPTTAPRRSWPAPCSSRWARWSWRGSPFLRSGTPTPCVEPAGRPSAKSPAPNRYPTQLSEVVS